jgi:hypothetical protein
MISSTQGSYYACDSRAMQPSASSDMRDAVAHSQQ